MAKDTHTASCPSMGMPLDAVALNQEIARDTLNDLGRIEFGATQLVARLGTDSLWLFIGGRLALRTAWSPGGLKVTRLHAHRFEAEGALGRFDVQLTLEPDARLLRVTTRFTAATDLLVPNWPRDLYALGGDGQPASARGTVEAAQRGLNTALVYFTLCEPDFGTVLYLQNLTALNPWHQATGTKPEGVVGGNWPELGYQPKPATETPLRGGVPLTMSDILLGWNDTPAEGEAAEAAQFLDLLARAYRRLDDAPATEFRDWPARCATTLRHLERSPKATIRHYGHTYLHPYTAAEYPDCMVQMSVAQSLHQYADWKGKPVAFEAKLLAGMSKFYDSELGTLRRYLPNVGDDKNADAVDSWYLYHPLLNLGRMALGGHEPSRALFLKCLDYGIRAARHFRYDWPVMFDVTSFKVITEERKPDGPGQSDVGGIYAYVMLLAEEVTGERRYRQEAEKALAAMKGWKFELLYQANLSAWGAVACVRLWKTTGRQSYLEQAQVFLAGIFHNALMWESELGTAVHFRNFLGATCLHDGPYMALYECFETFDAFEEIMARGGEELPDDVRLLLSEYRRYALCRAWSYFPDALPAEILPPEDEVRNGHIDRKLSFPLEDLYADGQAPGQVGQEIYGCGAPFTFAARAFRAPDGAPFILFAEYPVRDLCRHGSEISFWLDGDPARSCKVRLLPRRSKALPGMWLAARALPPDADGAVTFTATAKDPICIRWQADD